MNSRMPKALLGLFVILALVLNACVAANESNTTDKTEKSSKQTVSSAMPSLTEAVPASSKEAGQDTKEPETAEHLAEEAYNLDRNHVDLSRYQLEEETDGDGNPIEPAYAQQISDALFEQGAEEGKVKLYQLDVDPVYRKESKKFSFSFQALPPYEEEKEQTYFFNGSRISFVIPDFDSSTGYESLYGRAIPSEEDHAFVLKHIAQAMFVPYVQDSGVPLEPRLFICIENENGITDTFIIQEDMRILHAAEPYGEEAMDAKITDISVDPISPYSYLKLAALAAWHLRTEREESRDLFGIYRSFYSAGQTFEEVVGEAYKHLEIRIGYQGKERILDNAEDFESFIRIFCEGIEEQYTETVFESQLTDASFREDGVHVSIKGRLEEGQSLPSFRTEFWVTPDGQVWQEPEQLSVCTSGGIRWLYMRFCAPFVTYTLKAYPFDEVIFYLK